MGTLAIVLAPWLTGLLAPFALRNKRLCQPAPSKFFFASSLLFGSFFSGLAFLVIALSSQLLIVKTGHLVLPFFTLINVLMVLLAISVMVIISKKLQSVATIKIFNFNVATSFVLSVFIMTIAISFYTAMLTPLSGWDSIDHWALQSARLIRHAELANVAEPFAYEHRHPLALKIILAWSAVTQLEDKATYFVGLPWTLIWLSCCLQISAMTLLASSSFRYAALTGLVAATLPLLANHGLIYGYGEIFMSFFCLSFCSAAAYRSEYGGGVSFLIMVLALLSLLFTKNSGPIFAAFLISSLILAHLSRKSKIAFIIALITTAICVITISVKKLYFFKTGYTGSFILLAGRKLKVRPSDPLEVLDNLTHMLVINSSFSLLLITSIFALMYSYSKILTTHRVTLVFLVLSCLGLILFQFTDLGFRHAVPGNDTGGSRFWIPVSVAAMLLITQIFGAEQQPEKSITSVNKREDPAKMRRK